MDSAGLVARSMARAVRLHRAIAIGTIAGTAVGILLAALVASLVVSILTAVSSGTAVTAVEADVIVAGRAPGGMSHRLADSVVERANESGAVEAVPVVIVNTRVAGETSSVLTIMGVDERPERLLDQFDPDHVRMGAEDPEEGVFVSADWASSNGYELGDTVELSGPGGRVPVPITGVTDEVVPNDGAIAMMDREELADRFGRPGIDSVFLSARSESHADQLVDALRPAVGGAAMVGTAKAIVDAEQSSFAFVRQILMLVGVAGLLTAAAVVYICWRMVIAAEQRTIAGLRLVGARGGALVVGSGLLFLGSVAIAAAIGVPLGVLATGSLVDFAQQTVTFTGLAASAKPPVVFVPLAAGLAAGLFVGGVAWAAGLRRLLRVSTIEALRPSTPSRSKGRVPATAVALAIGLLAVAVIVGQVLPPASSGVGLLLVLVAAALFAAAAPALIGAALASRGGLRALAVGRAASRGGSHSGVLVVLGIALTLSVALGGLTSSLGAGLSSSIEAWTKGDLYVLPARPGLNLRDEKFPPAAADTVAALPEVESVVPYTLSMVRYQDRNVQLWAWGTKGVDEVVDLQVEEGLRSGELWEAFDEGAVAVSTNFALLHDLDVGDRVEMPSASGAEDAEIVALVNDYTGDTGVIMTSFDTYTRITGDDRAVDLIVTIADGVDPGAATAAIERALAGYPQLTVWSGERMRDELMGTLGQVLGILQGLGLIAVVLAVLVGVTTSAVGLVTRRREAAVYRLSGATGSWVSGSLLTESLLLGGLAWLVAVPCGLASIQLMINVVGSQSSTFPPQILPVGVVIATLPLGVAAMAVGVWLPTRGVGRMDIADAIDDD